MNRNDFTREHADDLYVDMATDEQLEGAAGYAGPGRTTWDSTSCSGCSVSVC
ncbi:hypothetical protein [Mycolicibacterium sp.]|uniref:hypothetical protein n=1 Tax=Mycolicibacterium sp. TaxID=2320850 RepID=UPI003D11BDC5